MGFYHSPLPKSEVKVTSVIEIKNPIYAYSSLSQITTTPNKVKTPWNERLSGKYANDTAYKIDYSLCFN